MEKPKLQLTGTDGNIFAVVGAASRVLKKAGQGDKVTEMTNKVFAAGSYDEALGIVMQYVDAE